MLSNLTDLKILKTPTFKLLTHLLIKCKKPNSSESEILAIAVADRGDYCPRGFDGFACWFEPSGAKSYFQNCPEYIVGFDPIRYSFNQCIDDGSWLRNQTNAIIPWTNTTACVDTNDFSFMGIINIMDMCGYTISTVALIISITTMKKFQSLHCIRNRIHIHVFTAYVFNNLCWLLTYATVVRNPSVIIENKAWCQILHVLTHYFMLSGYSWMFCEALHLFLSLAVVFIEEKLSMRLFKFIGWVVTAFIVGAYSIRRHYTPGGTEKCWIEDSDATRIINIPVMLSLLTSLVFLVYIIRVLMKKVETHPNESNLQTYMKGARATMMLIPLFGLHFVLMPFGSSTETISGKIYQVFSSVLMSFQGLYLSVLFCFSNLDVITAFRNYFRRLRNARDAGQMGGITGADSTQHTPENTI